VGCCLTGCFRLILWALWRAIFAALLAVVWARVDEYVDRRYRDRPAGRLYRRWRGRSGIRKGTPPNAGSAIDVEVRRSDQRKP
jgi:hypothetical protein